MNPADQSRAHTATMGGIAHGAANDDLGPAAQIARDLPAPEVGGWDPFDVWRTRVRDPRRDWNAQVKA